ncbi:hypothetical protein AMS68_004009 [Peltaster fructicola]|uniref:E3 ubiquitin-protein ligase listerin n=1 Tax=Peltaster fructicola TaxID=286661 RepID=A0A6H0XUR2_9PEZI|nr:hypothetical protein AMS68_004009 [Peltaster fructicola]
MSKRQFKASASSGRAVAGFGGFGSSNTTQSSVLSYIQEPLDLQSISDAKVIVIFKNLAKKDDTTKARALDELQNAIDEQTGLEESVLEAWVRVFPRLSIDNSRRVRQLAHTVNGKICSTAGKRTAKHMPTIAGPWLAGIHDNDRTVAKSAQEALNLVFSDTAKIAALRKVYHKAILDYCKDAVLHETVSSLSDERTVSHDDAENTYARVVSSSLALVASLINETPAVELSKQQELYSELLDKQTTDFAIHTDAGIRRSAHRLVRLATLKLEDILQQRLQQISEVYIYKGLRSDQLASSLDYTTTLVILTQHFPTIWTDAYTGKKAPASRLSHFLKQGSQGATVEFWTQLSQLITSLPQAVLPTTIEEVNEMMSASRKGLSRKEERFQAAETWRTHQDLTCRFVEQLDSDARKSILELNILPAFKQYMFPADETSEWTIAGGKPASVLAQLAQIPHFSPVLIADLPNLSTKLVELMKLSQPEQSKEHEKSQLQVAAAGSRWSGMQREILCQPDIDTLLGTAFTSEDVVVITEALQLCSSRNGKIYGAAAVVDNLIRDCGSELIKQGDVRQVLSSFVTKQLPAILLTPSSRYLLSCLSVLQGDSEFSVLFSETLESMLDLDGPVKQKAQLIATLHGRSLPQDVIKASIESARLQAFALSICQWRPTEEEVEDSTLTKLLSAGVVARSTQLQCIKQLVASLHDEHTVSWALRQLDVLAATHQDILVAYDTDPIACDNHLISNALRLTESEDTKIAGLATDLQTKLSLTSGATGNARLSTIRHALEDVSSSSSSVETLSELAEKLLGPDSSDEDFLVCLPEAPVWRSDLSNHLPAPPSSLSISSPLGSAVYLVDQNIKHTGDIPYDADGFSKVLRRAIFFVKLLASTKLAEALKSTTTRSLQEMVILSVVTINAAQDKVSIASANKLWLQDPVTEAAFLAYADDGIECVATLVGEMSADQFNTLLNDTTVSESDSSSPLAYYLASARLQITLMRAGRLGTAEKQDLPKVLVNDLKQDTFATLARLSLASQTPAEHAQITKLTNELVATLTGTKFAENLKSAELQLMALNTILKSEDAHILRVAKQRLIFLVKHLIQELQQTESRIVGEEVLQALGHLLPAMLDIYGEHWAETLKNIVQTWSSIASDYQGSDHIPTLYYTLRLYEVLRKLTSQEEVSEDLVEILEEKGLEIANTLVSLLKTTTNEPDESDQPLMITNVLLARQISTLKVQPTFDSADLLPILYAPSASVQQATFTLLHNHIPKAQEQVSMEAALDNKVARLPDELLSMLLEAPAVDGLDEDDFDRSIPAVLQGYLYSWRLLFDHFNSSSFKVRSDYSDQIKDGAYLSKLLSATFSFLGHVRGKPVDVSGHDIADYQANQEADAEKDARWLFSHLYYQALLHLPSLVKGYVLELRTRQTPALIEEWTAKHISPALITANLQAVQEWSEKTVKEDPEYEKMTVKVASRSKEVNVSYVVDEQTMAIKIVLPDAYPLATALVQTVNRVAVKEDQWQSWLRNCQGVINFSNGSITDGLTAWRRNVTGALKGQTECAICYSIVSGDKQLPTKKCPTCKNLFHSSCLFKWFKTSNASTCPLCRNSFNFN